MNITKDEGNNEGLNKEFRNKEILNPDMQNSGILHASNPLMIIVDMQKVYGPGKEWECPNYEVAKENILKLLKAGLTTNVCATRFIAPVNPVGVWKDYNQKYAEINENKYANELDDDIAIACNERGYPVYDKSTYSSLKLKEIYEKANTVPYAVVTGVTTGCCVLSTVMDLIDAGIYVVLIKDATAGSSIECENAVWETLKGLSPLHLLMIDTDEYLRRLGNSARL